MIVDAGAQLALSESEFPEAKEGTTLVGPQVLVNVDHSKLVPSRACSQANDSNGCHDGGDVWSCRWYYEGRV